MTNSEFESIRKRRQGKSDEVLIVKGNEYSPGIDRLHNFKRVAERCRISPSHAAVVLESKHDVRLNDIIINDLPITIELIDEIIGDKYNYLQLLEALLWEKLQEQEKGKC